MGKYFNVTVKPTITASKQTGAFADADVLFDWTAFDIPKGANRLISITSLVRGTNGADQASGFDFELFFAKSDSNGTAPTTFGDDGAAVDTPGWFNNLIGMQFFDVSSNNIGSSNDLVYMSMFQSGSRGGGPDLVLQGEADSGANVGYDTIYVAGIAQGAFSFSTAVETTAAEDVSALSTAIIGGTSALDNGSGGTAATLNKFVVGDILHAEDDIILGEISALTANTITFRHDGVNQLHGNGNLLYEVPDDLTAWKIQNGAGAAGDLADGDEIYNIHPITLRFGLEK